MKVLVIGGSGFIGSSFIKRWGQSLPVRDILYPAHSDLDLVNYDAVQTFVKDQNVTHIVHCAHVTKKSLNGARQLADNLAMVANIVKAADCKLPIILLTSGSVYRETYVGLYKEEQDVYFPSKEPAYSLWVISQFCQRLSLSNLVELRLFGVYGPGEPIWRLPSYCLVQAIHRKPIVIEENRKMSWIYVYDLCDIIKDLIFFPKSGVFNTATENAHVTDIATMAVDIAKNLREGVDSEIVIKGYGKDYTGDFGKFNGYFHFPPTPLKMGISHMYEKIMEESNDSKSRRV